MWKRWRYHAFTVAVSPCQSGWLKNKVSHSSSLPCSPICCSGKRGASSQRRRLFSRNSNEGKRAVVCVPSSRPFVDLSSLLFAPSLANVFSRSQFQCSIFGITSHRKWCLGGRKWSFFMAQWITVWVKTLSAERTQCFFCMPKRDLGSFRKLKRLLALLGEGQKIELALLQSRPSLVTYTFGVSVFGRQTRYISRYPAFLIKVFITHLTTTGALRQNRPWESSLISRFTVPISTIINFELVL